VTTPSPGEACPTASLGSGKSLGEAVHALELGWIWAGGDVWRRLREESSRWPVTSESTRAEKRAGTCPGVESKNLAGDILERARVLKRKKY
jgi:hypothetical protein